MHVQNRTRCIEFEYLPNFENRYDESIISKQQQMNPELHSNSMQMTNFSELKKTFQSIQCFSSFLTLFNGKLRLCLELILNSAVLTHTFLRLFKSRLDQEKRNVQNYICATASKIMMTRQSWKYVGQGFEPQHAIGNL